jgi:hypothetical protein
MSELERAQRIAQEVLLGCRPDTTCMVVQAAVAGLRGLGMRHIRLGSLFWPDGFRDDPHLSMRGGWGCEGFDERTGRLYLADTAVDPDDGGFSGHTWVEPVSGIVVDLMHDVDRGMRHHEGRRYIPRPPLERAVKAYWRPQMQAAIKLGRRQKSPTE